MSGRDRISSTATRAGTHLRSARVAVADYSPELAQELADWIARVEPGVRRPARCAHNAVDSVQHASRELQHFGTAEQRAFAKPLFDLSLRILDARREWLASEGAAS